MMEQTLILIKPDGVKRNLIGKIISRLEDSGLKVCALKMVWPDAKLAEQHYPLDEEWAKAVFKKTKTAFEKENKEFEFSDYKKYGKFIQDSLKEFIRESPVVALVVKGPHAIEIVRKMVGVTEPRQAAPGTIRGDFASIESYERSNADKRAVRNLIHASDSPENAQREISLWFSKDEIHDYEKKDDYMIF